MKKPRFKTFVYPRIAIIECNLHGKRASFSFEEMNWEENAASPDRICFCLKKVSLQAELYFINRFENEKFD